MSLKALLKSDGVRRIGCWIGAHYIRFVHATGRWQTVRGDIPQRFWDTGQPFILSFWHGRLLMMPYCWRHGIPIHNLVSHHRDGQLIARTVLPFGFRSITGSKALREMVKVLKAGEYVGMTPDGPRGPRMRAGDGVISVARLAGVPIVPVTYSVRRGRNLGTWDRFLVAAPFSRGVIVWGDPVEVSRDADADAAEAARQRVEAQLNAITEEADHLVGRDPVPPAPAPGEGAAA